MKALYWRPQRVSLRVLALLAFVSLATFLSVERFRARQRQPYYAEKNRAAQLTLRGMRTVKEHREKLGLGIDPETDPTESGLMGTLLSPITTNTGYPGAKQTSINPNFGAVVVHYLKRAGVREGEPVAVGLSASFPALNIAVYAAIETIGARPLVISSVGSSQWGANLPELTWLDMEKALFDAGVFGTQSLAVTYGGVDDRALGLSPRGKQMLTDAIQRSGRPLLEPADLKDGIERRMALYREHAGDAEIRAYVNVGGGTSSVGTRVGKQLFKPGLNKTPPRGPLPDSVMTRFSQDGVPVIHLTQISRIAEENGLPEKPRALAPIGEGTVFVRDTYNRWLAGGGLVLIVAMMFALLRFDLGHRLLAKNRGGDAPSHSEPMV